MTKPPSLPTDIALSLTWTGRRLASRIRAAARRGDSHVTPGLIGLADEYAERMERRLVEARNTVRYNQSYDMAAIAARHLQSWARAMHDVAVHECARRYVGRPGATDVIDLPVETYPTRQQVADACAWAVAIVRVEGGWLVFAAHCAYDLWRSNGGAPDRGRKH